jgi:hypothetical protein
MEPETTLYITSMYHLHARVTVVLPKDDPDTGRYASEPRFM